jgi:hypothetical protein
MSEAIENEDGLELSIAAESQIAHFKAECIKKFGAQEAFSKAETKERLLERFRASYQMSVVRSGEVSSLAMGSNSAFELRKSDHTIEAWRLLNRLIAISKQYHGPEHKTTKDLDSVMRLFKTAGVVLWGELFEVLRHEADNKYVVRGPVEVDEKRKVTMKVDEADVMLQPCVTPVVCHGFKNKAAYLNGKIGDMRSFDATAGSYGFILKTSPSSQRV